ncbi:MAG: hypothetical protein AAF763_12075 [Pseudomonadota bacterium]
MQLVQVRGRGREAHVARDRFGGARIVAGIVGAVAGLSAVHLHLIHAPLPEGLSPVGLYALGGGWSFVSSWKALGLSLGGGLRRAAAGGLITLALGVAGFAMLFGLHDVATSLGSRTFKDTKHVFEVALLRGTEVLEALPGSPALLALVAFAICAPLLCEGLHRRWRWRGAEAI